MTTQVTIGNKKLELKKGASLARLQAKLTEAGSLDGESVLVEYEGANGDRGFWSVALPQARKATKEFFDKEGQKFEFEGLVKYLNLDAGVAYMLVTDMKSELGLDEAWFAGFKKTFEEQCKAIDAKRCPGSCDESSSTLKPAGEGEGAGAPKRSTTKLETIQHGSLDVSGRTASVDAFRDAVGKAVPFVLQDETDVRSIDKDAARSAGTTKTAAEALVAAVSDAMKVQFETGLVPLPAEQRERMVKDEPATLATAIGLPEGDESNTLITKIGTVFAAELGLPIEGQRTPADDAADSAQAEPGAPVQAAVAPNQGSTSRDRWWMTPGAVLAALVIVTFTVLIVINQNHTGSSSTDGDTQTAQVGPESAGASGTPTGDTGDPSESGEGTPGDSSAVAAAGSSTDDGDTTLSVDAVASGEFTPETTREEILLAFIGQRNDWIEQLQAELDERDRTINGLEVQVDAARAAADDAWEAVPAQVAENTLAERQRLTDAQGMLADQYLEYEQWFRENRQARRLAEQVLMGDEQAIAKLERELQEWFGLTSSDHFGFEVMRVALTRVYDQGFTGLSPAAQELEVYANSGLQNVGPGPTVPAYAIAFNFFQRGGDGYSLKLDDINPAFNYYRMPVEGPNGLIDRVLNSPDLREEFLNLPKVRAFAAEWGTPVSDQEALLTQLKASEIGRQILVDGVLEVIVSKLFVDRDQTLIALGSLQQQLEASERQRQALAGRR